MANVKVFVGLLLSVQAFFIFLDSWDLWSVHRTKGGWRVLSESRGVVGLVALSCIFYFLVQIGLSAATPSISKFLAWAGALAGTSPGPRFDWQTPLWIFPVVLLAYSAVTFFDYLTHRFLLHRVLWSLHENHHVPTVVSNLMPGIAARPFVAIPNLIINFSSCFAVFGIVRLSGHPELLGAFIRLMPALIVLFAFIASASHSSFLRRFDFVEVLFRGLLVISPREHALHHAANLNGNYGNFTSVWDRLFGTYLAPEQCINVSFGLDYDQDFLGAITAGRLKLSDGFRNRYQVGRVCHIEKPESSNLLIRGGNASADRPGPLFANGS